MARALLNQARAWFLRIDSVRECLYVYVCPPPEASGVIWTPYGWSNKFYSFCTAIAVVIGSGRGLRIEARRGN